MSRYEVSPEHLATCDKPVALCPACAEHFGLEPSGAMLLDAATHRPRVRRSGVRASWMD